MSELTREELIEQNTRLLEQLNTMADIEMLVSRKKDALKELNTEMLEALKYMKRLFRNADCDTDYIDSTIAKAEGRENANTD